MADFVFPTIEDLLKVDKTESVAVEDFDITFLCEDLLPVEETSTEPVHGIPGIEDIGNLPETNFQIGQQYAQISVPEAKIFRVPVREMPTQPIEGIPKNDVPQIENLPQITQLDTIPDLLKILNLPIENSPAYPQQEVEISTPEEKILGVTAGEMPTEPVQGVLKIDEPHIKNLPEGEFQILQQKKMAITIPKKISRVTVEKNSTGVQSRQIQEEMDISTTKNKVFLCEYCGKCYSNHRSLMNHSFLHTGVYPYYCERCHRGFRFHTKLKEHRRWEPYCRSQCKRAW